MHASLQRKHLNDGSSFSAWRRHAAVASAAEPGDDPDRRHRGLVHRGDAGAWVGQWCGDLAADHLPGAAGIGHHLLAAIYYGAMYGGAISSITLGIPGASTAVATTFDGTAAGADRAGEPGAGDSGHCLVHRRHGGQRPVHALCPGAGLGCAYLSDRPRSLR